MTADIHSLNVRKNSKFDRTQKPTILVLTDRDTKNRANAQKKITFFHFFEARGGERPRFHRVAPTDSRLGILLRTDLPPFSRSLYISRMLHTNCSHSESFGLDGVLLVVAEGGDVTSSSLLSSQLPSTALPPLLLPANNEGDDDDDDDDNRSGDENANLRLL